MSKLSITTYSMWRMFLNCRQKMNWRYIKELVPLERAACLSFGSVIHDCLEMWHMDRDLTKVLDHVDRAFADRARDERQLSDWHLARAMMTGYAERYPQENFEVVALEKQFEGPIINPKTGRASKSFVLAGKLDGIVKVDGEHYLLEHKTAATVDASYLEKLWTDLQIILYSWYAEKVWGIRIKGVIYNILVKGRLQQKKGETEEEFQDRRAALIAKSKTGKSSAKRRMPETDEEFQARLVEKYTGQDMFHREILYITRDQFRLVQEELWEMGQALLDAKRRNVYLPNRSNCFQFGRACPYLPLCRSGGSQNLIENLYRHEPPHQELHNADEPETDPVF